METCEARSERRRQAKTAHEGKPKKRKAKEAQTPGSPGEKVVSLGGPESLSEQ